VTRQQARDGPFSMLVWLTAVRDHPDRPPPMQRLVLDCLGLRMDWKTGQGFASALTLAKDADVCGRTVLRATAWARKHGLLVMEKRGHRLTDESVKATEWVLCLPSQHVTGDLLEDAPTGHGSPVGKAPTGQSGHPNVTIRPSQRDSTAPPSRPSSSKPSSSLARAGRDLGAALARLGATDEEIAFTIDQIKNSSRVDDPAAYMNGAAAKPGGVARLLDRTRRLLAAQDPDGDSPAVYPQTALVR
jgi:hypothetical protein